MNRRIYYKTTAVVAPIVSRRCSGYHCLRQYGSIKSSLSTAASQLPVHETATKGFTADSASIYETGRPSYSEETLRYLMNVVFSRSGSTEGGDATFLELGAGTGKFTKSFLDFQAKSETQKEFPRLNQVKFTATEPSEGFRESLVKSLNSHGYTVGSGSDTCGLEVAAAIGSAIPVENNSLDAVFVAQAFHWMANTETLQEVHRVLRPGCPLVMIWNSYDYSFDWLREVDEKILTPTYGEDTPRQQTGRWRDCFDTDFGKASFSHPVQTWEVPYTHHGTKQTIVDRIMSTSVVVESTQEKQQQILATLMNILDTHADLAEARASQKFGMNYITEVAWVDRGE
mmetsp:Transcript_13690/g.22823  ORF Transcript_13690/g.22823 Transcript_13690/m.22823 type:complete len:342 (+) Transcript_13690:41-1066(+)